MRPGCSIATLHLTWVIFWKINVSCKKKKQLKKKNRNVPNWRIIFFIYLFTRTSCTDYNWLSDWRLCAECLLPWLSIISQQESKGQKVTDDLKPSSPLLGSDSSLQCVSLYCTRFPADRRGPPCGQNSPVHVMFYPKKTQKKLWKTCRFPAACGLPTGSGAECQHQPHSAFGSVKMLFTKVKHIASPWVKGALWHKSGPGSGWTEHGFGCCKPGTIRDPLDRLPLVNSGGFFHPEPQRSSLSYWISAKDVQSTSAFFSSVWFHAQARHWAKWHRDASVLPLCFHTHFLKREKDLLCWCFLGIQRLLVVQLRPTVAGTRWWRCTEKYLFQ